MVLDTCRSAIFVLSKYFFIYLSYPLPALVWLSTKRGPQKIIFVPNMLKAIARRREPPDTLQIPKLLGPTTPRLNQQNHLPWVAKRRGGQTVSPPRHELTILYPERDE